MTINILIGVGGTGAKIVEAAMVMAAAGLGPKHLHVGLVDQDNANGNVARTKTLIANYRKFRNSWQGAIPSSVIDWRGDRANLDGLDLCRTEVEELFEEGPVWCPGGDQTTLRAIVGQNLAERQRHLFDLLFMPGEEEQDLQLGEGYRGRAHVGAAALISRLIDPRNPLTAKLSQLMTGGGGRERVNVFIAGSSFGGTGAAGFPTIARELHRIRTAKDFTNKGEVMIGGALMLPYFGFAAPGEEERGKVVTTDELLPKAQLALEHYDNLFDSERTFDAFYLVGWDRFFQLGYHQAGNAEQCNPPLLPELFAAAAALGFLNRDKDDGKADDDVPVLISARSGRHLRWSDLPLEGVEDKIGQLLRFAVYWRYSVAELVEARRPLLGKGNWTHALRDNAKKEDAVHALFVLDQLIENILQFAASLEACAPDNWDIGPWRLGALRDARHPPTPIDPIRLVAWHGDGAGLFSALIRKDDGEPIERDAAIVYDELVTRGDELAQGEHRGFGRIVAAAYRAARVR